MNGTTNFSSNMRENVPPAACRGDGEWEHEKQRGSYLGKGYNRKVWGGGSDCLWGGQVGERSVLVGSVQFPLLMLSCLRKVITEMEIVIKD